MKLLFVLLSLVLLSSCSTSKMNMSLSQKIEAEEVRSLREIQSHIVFLLESHPELDLEMKNKLSVMLDDAIVKLQDLKSEESKIFQLLLKKSLKVNQLTDSEVKDKSRLELRLKHISHEKLKNILSLITKVTSLSDQEAINESVNNDMMYLMRDLR